jgi:hypothetical protein
MNGMSASASASARSSDFATFSHLPRDAIPILFESSRQAVLDALFGSDPSRLSYLRLSTRKARVGKRDCGFMSRQSKALHRRESSRERETFRPLAIRARFRIETFLFPLSISARKLRKMAFIHVWFRFSKTMRKAVFKPRHAILWPRGDVA